MSGGFPAGLGRGYKKKKGEGVLYHLYSLLETGWSDLAGGCDGGSQAPLGISPSGSLASSAYFPGNGEAVGTDK